MPLVYIGTEQRFKKLAHEYRFYRKDIEHPHETMWRCCAPKCNGRASVSKHADEHVFITTVHMCVADKDLFQAKIAEYEMRQLAVIAPLESVKAIIENVKSRLPLSVIDKLSSDGTLRKQMDRERTRAKEEAESAQGQGPPNAGTMASNDDIDRKQLVILEAIGDRQQSDTAAAVQPAMPVVAEEPSMRPVTLGRGTTRMFHYKEKKSDNHPPLKFDVNQFVLLDCRHLGRQYARLPQVGQVIEKRKDDENRDILRILWYSGSKTGVWKEWKERRNGSMAAIYDDIPMSDVISDGFAGLTNSNKLPVHVVTAIESYEKEDVENNGSASKKQRK